MVYFLHIKKVIKLTIKFWKATKIFKSICFHFNLCYYILVCLGKLWTSNSIIDQLFCFIIFPILFHKLLFYVVFTSTLSQPSCLVNTLKIFLFQQLHCSNMTLYLFAHYLSFAQWVTTWHQNNFSIQNHSKYTLFVKRHLFDNRLPYWLTINVSWWWWPLFVFDQSLFFHCSWIIITLSSYFHPKYNLFIISSVLKVYTVKDFHSMKKVMSV